MIELNEIEHKFLELRSKSISIEDFENWVYENESLIKRVSSESIYDELIIFNYKTVHSKVALPKILAINYERLESFQLQEVLIKLINSSEFELENITHDIYDSVYDAYSRLSFGFEINGFGIYLNNPFNFGKAFIDLSDDDKCEKFKIKFKNSKFFFKFILEELESSSLKLVTNERLESLDGIDYSREFSGLKSDLLIFINGHRIIMDKAFLLLKMKEYWNE